MSRSGEVGRDRVGGVAVQAVPGMVVPASRAGVLVAAVVLDVAQGRADVEREGDRRMPQAVRGQLVPGLDARVAGQAADQLPQVPLPEVAAAAVASSGPASRRASLSPQRRARSAR